MDVTKILRRSVLLIFIFTIPAIGYAQHHVFESDKVLPPSGNVRLDSLGVWMSKKYNLVFSFNSAKIHAQSIVKIPRQPMKLCQLLSLLKEKLQLEYSIYGNHVIFHNKRTATAKPPTAEKQTVLVKDRKPLRKSINSSEARNYQQHPASRTRVAERETKPLLVSSAVAYTQATYLDTAHITLDLLEKPVLQPIRKALLLERVPQIPLLALSDKAPTHNAARHWYTPLVAASVSADETMYLNAMIKAGIPWMHAMVARSTNFDVATFMYGLGSTVRLSDKWGLELSGLTGGRFSKRFNILTPPDTGELVNFEVKGSFSRISLMVEKEWKDRLTVRFGPVLNILKTSYFSGDSLVNPASLLSESDNFNVDRGLYAIKPLYTIRNTYNESTTGNEKIWIGFQIGLQYRLSK